MDNTQTASTPLYTAWKIQARANPGVVVGLAVATLVIFLLVVAGGYTAFTGNNQEYVGYAAIGGAAGFGATALGALMAIGLRSVSSRAQDIMLGFAAGMMLAASFFSLILPGLAARPPRPLSL